MKPYHDPRAACALPFSLARSSYVKRMRRVERAAGRKTIKILINKVQDEVLVDIEARTKDGKPAVIVMTPVRDVTDEYRYSTKPCVYAKSWRKAVPPARPNWYDHAAAKYGVTRDQIKMMAHAYGGRMPVDKVAELTKVARNVVVQLYCDLDAHCTVVVEARQRP